MCKIIGVGVFMLWMLSWVLWLLLSIVAEFKDDVVSKLFIFIPMPATLLLGLYLLFAGGCNG